LGTYVKRQKYYASFSQELGTSAQSFSSMIALYAFRSTSENVHCRVAEFTGALLIFSLLIYIGMHIRQNTAATDVRAVSRIRRNSR